MPYVSQAKRDEMRGLSVRDIGHGAGFTHDVGALTYVLSEVIAAYVEGARRERGEIKYEDLADVLGALSATSTEFSRRVVAPYEDLKLQENGDVFGALFKARDVLAVKVG